MQPILSARDPAWHEPVGSPRRYLIAPLTRLERNRWRAAMVAGGANLPAPAVVWQALRDALRALAPSNLTELLALVDAAETEDREGAPGEASAALAPVERACRAVPAFAALLAERQFWLDSYPPTMARFALRGWEGPDLPPFVARNGEVPAELMEAIPDMEVRSIGVRAYEMSFLNRSAEKNSEPPSPSAETPTASAEA